MTLFGDPNLVGLFVQAIGALLIATLCLVLQQTVRRAPLVYWAAGWLALFASLMSLFLAHRFPAFRQAGQFVYVFGEYHFGYLVMVGCRLYGRGQKPTAAEAWLVIPAAFLAALLPLVGGGDFNGFFTVHTLVYACLFLAALRFMWAGHPSHRSVAGERVMKVALVLLTVDYAQYAPVFAATSLGWVSPTPYLQYAPFYDLIVLVLLAFGMMMVITGEVQQALEEANADLAQARDRLEAIAQLDHLTSALNRHSFYSIIEDPRTPDRSVVRGCAAFADIDNMKAINDAYGHTAGDDAIRAVATAVRSCIRADDLLFRWGGDEFLVLLMGVSETEARARLDGLNHRLTGMEIPGVNRPVDLRVSIGFAAFDSASSLDDVIALADSAMYGRKRTMSAVGSYN